MTSDWTDVAIPSNRLAAVSGKECEAWLVEHVVGSAIGHQEGGELMVRFSDAADAKAFKARWLDPPY